MKKSRSRTRGILIAGIGLLALGSIILAIMGITELTRGLVTPCFAFGMMFVIYGWPKSKKSQPD